MTNETRYFSASRRALLRRGAALGAAVALPGLVVACGNSDQETFAQDDRAIAETSAADPTASTTTPPSTPSSAATAAANETAEAEALRPLAIAYTYTMADGGKRLNPYLAVWIEDTDGALLRTVDLTYQQDRKGAKWLDDLKDWWRVDQSRISAGGPDLAATISSATRSPGSHSLLWDGLDDNGEPVLNDDVVVCIESARERGPHSLICHDVTRSSVAGPVTLAADGELSGATIDLA